MTKTIILIPPPTKGERKQVEREALEEEEDGEEEIVRVLLGLVVREEAVVDSNIRLWNTTVDAVAVAVATAIDGCVGRGCGREKRVKQNKDTEVK
jgi:phage-related minor tail protein